MFVTSLAQAPHAVRFTQQRHLAALQHIHPSCPLAPDIPCSRHPLALLADRRFALSVVAAGWVDKLHVLLCLLLMARRAVRGSGLEHLEDCD